MHSDEIWQTYYRNGEPIVGEGWEASWGNPEVSGSDAIVGVAVVVLYRVNNDGVLEILWQRRSERVDRYPGDFDFSAGGHINLGESVVRAGVRECYEEIGAEILEDDLNFVTMRPFNKNRFAYVFTVDYTGREEDFKFVDTEVSEVRWVAFSETESFRKEFAKAPLKKDALTFEALAEWFSQRGLVLGGADFRDV